ncbi:MAG: hypothetical protein V4732_12615 [Pseudomonadota bacterium]
MSYAVTQTNPSPPGTLPCPDGNGDGLSDPLNVLGNCSNQLGLVPFRTLEIPQPLDGSNTSIWYAVANEYSRTLGAATRNSSVPSSLMVNVNQRMAFILLAPNEPLLSQARTSRVPLVGAVAQFLEGENANTSLNFYSDFRDGTQNDQVVGMPEVTFWANIEGRVLREVNDRLDDYFNLCGFTLPPAAPFGTDNSIGPSAEGGMPFNLTASCATAVPLPGWLTTHWSRMLYYANCAVPNCIQLVDIAGNNTQRASTIVISPGIHLNQPLRTVGVRDGYYELENASFLPPDNRFTQIKPSGITANFNDLIYVVR